MIAFLHGARVTNWLCGWGTGEAIMSGEFVEQAMRIQGKGLSRRESWEEGLV